MQRVAQYIARHLKSKGINVLIYLDNVVGLAAPEEETQHVFEALQRLLCALGLSLAHHKMTPPTKVIQWLGLVLDINTKSLHIEQGKIGQTLVEMTGLYNTTHMSRRQVQLLAGRINHLTKACRPARLFMSRVLAHLRGHPARPTAISRGTKADLKWFTSPRSTELALYHCPFLPKW